VRCLPRRATALAALICACLVVTLPASAGAQTLDGTIHNNQAKKHAVDRQINAAKNDLDDISTTLTRAVAALQATQAKVAAAQVDLTQKQGIAALAEARNAAVTQQLAVAQASADRAADELAATKQRAVQTNNVIGTLARQTYQGSNLSTLAAVLQAQSPDDYATGMALADTAARLQNDALRQIAVQRAEEAATTAKLTAARDQVAALQVQVQAALAAATAAAEQAAAAKATLDSLAAQQRAEVAAVAAQKAAEKSRLDALQAQSNHLAKVLAALARRQHGGIYRRPGGFLSYPAIGPLSSPFGMRFHPILHVWRMHTGQDWAIPCGTPVHAAANGRIISAGWAGGYGNRIVIDHGRVNGRDLATTYNHLSRIVRHSGHVVRGQLIGYSGTTGLSTGCHLHFEVRINGTPVDPKKYL
jgi:murein DD-endopeptidase MepM/ murein hydrolase activator NlpD